uniref:Uncharacterized protein n=1 Tax=Xiphophorus couchianus TaxID=32473 RepID=A0A3B5MPP3_9TELE
MPADQISVTDFVAETNEDYKAPTTSSFTTRMSHCRNTVGALEEVGAITHIHSASAGPSYKPNPVRKIQKIYSNESLDTS